MQHKRRKLTVFLNGNLKWNFIQDNRISWKQETKFMLENIPHNFVTTKQFYRFSSLLFLTARTGDFFVFDSSCYATITETSLSNNVYIKTSTVTLSLVSNAKTKSSLCHNRSQGTPSFLFCKHACTLTKIFGRWTKMKYMKKNKISYRIHDSWLDTKTNSYLRINHTSGKKGGKQVPLE